MKRWEYKRLEVGPRDEGHLPLRVDAAIGDLTDAGADGWEFVQFYKGVARIGNVTVEAHCALLKREVTP